MTPEPTDKPTIEPCYQEGCDERCDSFCRPQSFPKTGMSWTVECLSCGYNTGDMDTEEQATAAHNAIARKVADYPTVLAERDAFQLQNTQLRRELARAGGLRDVLKSVEWVYSYAERKCPVCFNVPAAGHTAGCKLFAALANAPDAGEGGDDDSR